MMLRLNKRFPSWLIVIGKGSIADSCYSNLPWFYLFFFFIFLCQWDFIKKSQVVWSSLHSFTGECPSFPAFCLWHGHCTVADWLKDTLIRSLSIWHVFSKESSLFFFCQGVKKGPCPLLHLLHSLPLLHASLTVGRGMVREMIAATTCWPAKDWRHQLGESSCAALILFLVVLPYICATLQIILARLL